MVAPREPLTDYLAVEGGRLKSIDQILARSSADLGKQIRALKVVDEETAMTRIQLRAQQSAIKAHLAQDWKDIAKATDAGQRDAVVAASKTISKYENEMWSLAGVPQADLRDMADMEAKRAARSVRTMMDREQSSFKPLAASVYRSKAISSGMVDNAVNSALARGLSVDQFASEIERLVNPTAPGGVSYVARRLARTEINNAYHAGSKRRYDESGMVEACEWHKSKSHPEGDECDDLEANSPYDADKVPDKPHPQCLCYITPALPDQEEFLKNVLSDKYGRQKSFIKEVAPEAITAAALGTVAIRVAPYAFRYAKRRILKSSLQKGPKIALKALNTEASREEIGDALAAARAAARKAQRDQLEELVRKAAETGDNIRDIAQQVKPVEIPKAPTPNAGALKPGAIITDIRDRLPAGKIAANDLAKDSGNAIKGPRKAPANPLAPKVIEDHGTQPGVDLAKFRQARPEDFDSITAADDATRVAIEHYTSGVSYDISDALRAGKIPGPDPIDSSVYEEMMKLVTSTRTKEDLIVTRGIDVMSYSDFMPNVGPNKASWIGEVLEDKAFLSTSADDVPIWGNFELKIHVPKGTRGAYIDDFSMTPGQYEFVLPPDTKLKVVGVRDVKYTKKQLGTSYFEERENSLEKTILDVIAITDDEALEIAAKRKATPLAKAAVKVEGPDHLKVLNAAEYGSAQERLDAVNLVKELNPKAYAKIPEGTIAKLVSEAATDAYPSYLPEVRTAIEAGKRSAKAAIKKEAEAAKALLAVADDASPAAIKAASKAPAPVVAKEAKAAIKVEDPLDVIRATKAKYGDGSPEHRAAIKAHNDAQDKLAKANRAQQAADLKTAREYTVGSFEFNDALRKGRDFSKPFKLGTLSSTDLQALDRVVTSETLRRPVEVRRVVSGDAAREILGDAENSRIYSDKAFMSTQKADRGSLADAIDDYGQGDDTIVVLEMSLPKGYAALEVGRRFEDFPGFYDEGEVIIPRNAKFKPVSIKKGPNGEWRIEMQPE
jgi:hypothetical protein